MGVHRWLGSVALQRDHGPDRLDYAEGPGAREEAVEARQGTAASEGEDEPSASSFQRIHQDHERNGAGTKESEHTQECANAIGPLWPSARGGPRVAFGACPVDVDHSRMRPILVRLPDGALLTARQLPMRLERITL